MLPTRAFPLIEIPYLVVSRCLRLISSLLESVVELFQLLQNSCLLLPQTELEASTSLDFGCYILSWLGFGFFLLIAKTAVDLVCNNDLLGVIRTIPHFSNVLFSVVCLLWCKIVSEDRTFASCVLFLICPCVLFLICHEILLTRSDYFNFVFGSQLRSHFRFRLRSFIWGQVLRHMVLWDNPYFLLLSILVFNLWWCYFITWCFFLFTITRFWYHFGFLHVLLYFHGSISKWTKLVILTLLT